jgi:ribonuclease Z
MRPVELQLGDLRLEGWSRAGDETWFRVHPPGLAFDVGRGAQQLAGARDVFLTHGHLDHALGLPWVLSQRSFHRGAHTRVFCPAPIAEPLAALVAAAERLEGGARTRYDWDLLPLAAGDRVAVGRNLTVEAFASDHVVPSLGFHLVRRKHRLGRDFLGRSGEELAALRAQGVAIGETVEETWLSYCGDTGPGVFESEPRLYESRVLMVECTFLGDEHRDKGEAYKHLHIDDLAAREERFQNENLVLHHLSRRYRVSDLRREVERRLPRLAGRVHILVEEEL